MARSERDTAIDPVPEEALGADAEGGAFTIPDEVRDTIIRETKGLPMADFVDGSNSGSPDPFGIPFGLPFNPEVTILAAHLIAAGINPLCGFVRLTAPGPRTDYRAAGAPYPWGPVKSILPDGDGDGHVKLVAFGPDGERTIQRSRDLSDGLPWPDDGIIEECRTHFAALNDFGKARYLARLVEVGHNPVTYGLPAVETV